MCIWFDVYVFGSMYKCVTSMYMYAVRCTCMRYDVHMCNLDLYECGSIYIFLIQCIYIRFDVYMLNLVVYVYGLMILSVTERHSNGTPYLANSARICSGETFIDASKHFQFSLF